MEDKVIETKSLKIKYDKLKKLGYKLSYGSKTENYIDISFVKVVDSVTFTIYISEKETVKRISTSNYDNSGIEPFTNKELLAVAEIIKEVCWFLIFLWYNKNKKS